MLSRLAELDLLFCPVQLVLRVDNKYYSVELDTVASFLEYLLCISIPAVDVHILVNFIDGFKKITHTDTVLRI